MTADSKLSGLMPDHARQRFADVAYDISAAESSAFSQLPAVAAKAAAISGHWEFMAPAQVVDAFLRDSDAFPASAQPAGLNRLRRAAVAQLALHHFTPADRLSPGVIACYPALFERIADFLTSPDAEDYGADYLAKDVRFALGLTVPAGVLSIDLRYRVSPKLVARNLGNNGGLAAAAAYFKSGPVGRWYNDHLDLRDMAEFNPAGWTRCFVILAEMLEANPDVKGITGVSWFYDPVLTEISPRMAYLRRTQVDNGAFLVRIGPGPEHTANATATSPTRRQLVESGQYTPTCYLIAWPRGPLIDWARRLRTDPNLAFA